MASLKSLPPLAATFAPVFARLQKKWGVGPGRLALILVTFAVGGSLCGWAGRKLMAATGWEKNIGWWIAYLLLITLLWPMCVMLVSILTGQFAFFRTYLRKMARRMGFGRKSQAPEKFSADEKQG